MADKDRRRQAILAVVLVALLLALVYTYRDVLVPGAEGSRADARIAGLDDRVRRMRGLPEISIERPALDTSYDPQRNLFRYSESPDAIRLRLEQEARQRRLREEAEAARVAQVERQKKAEANRPPRPPPPPRRPEFPYSYVAYLGELRDPLNYYAVLLRPGAGRRESKKEDILVVKAGETIDDQFVVKTIGIDELVVGYTDERFDQHTKVVKLVQAQEPTGRR